MQNINSEFWNYTKNFFIFILKNIILFYKSWKYIKALSFLYRMTDKKKVCFTIFFHIATSLLLRTISESPWLSPHKCCVIFLPIGLTKVINKQPTFYIFKEMWIIMIKFILFYRLSRHVISFDTIHSWLKLTN